MKKEVSRSAPKTRKPSKYSPETLRNALEEVKTGKKTIYAASKFFGIPKETIRKRILNNNGDQRGKPKALGDTEERLLIEWVIKCAEALCPKSRHEIMLTAGELYRLDETKPLNENFPSPGWYQKFELRHRDEFSRRTAQPLGKAKSIVTKEKLQLFFELVRKQFADEKCLDLMEKPENWFNVDEINFEMNLGANAKRAAKTKKGKPKENITVTYAVSADGRSVPPLVTFKETFSGIEAAAAEIGADFAFNQTASGWTQGDAFFEFVTKHLNHHWLEMKLARPIVLVINGNRGHHSLKLYRWCLDNEVQLFILPPNTTQMLAVAVFEPLKRKYDENYMKWKKLNVGEPFNEKEFIKLLKLSRDEVLSRKETIIDGWRATGLQPFNFDNLDVSHLPTQASEEPAEEADELPSNQKLELLPDDFDNFEHDEEQQDLFESTCEFSSGQPAVEVAQDLVGHKAKCRMCFQPVSKHRVLKSITESVRQKFFDLTNIEVRQLFFRIAFKFQLEFFSMENIF